MVALRGGSGVSGVKGFGRVLGFADTIASKAVYCLILALLLEGLKLVPTLLSKIPLLQSWFSLEKQYLPTY